MDMMKMAGNLLPWQMLNMGRDMVRDARSGPTSPAQASTVTPGRTPVRTVPIAGTAFAAPQLGGGSGAAEAPKSAYSPASIGDMGLVDLYRDRIAELGNDPEESAKEKIARMLINFGTGTASAASNTRGRSVGPGLGESIAGGAATMGSKELEHHTGMKDKAEDRQDKVFAHMKDMMQFQRAMAKDEDDRRYRAASLAKRGASYKRNPLSYALIQNIVPKLYEQGMSTEQINAEINSLMDVIRQRPELMDSLEVQGM